MKYPVSEIDVFTTVPLMGNPVAVVFDAAELSHAQMAQIANWTNFSETTFVTGVEADAYDLRIFTPRGELPFAGHPSVGTAFALRTRGLFEEGIEQVTQRCEAGPIAVRFDGEATFVRVPEPRISEVSTASADVAAALGIDAVSKPVRVNVGPVWIVARIESIDALRALAPDGMRVSRVSTELRATGITVYSVDGPLVEVRSFAPGEGVAEDPVCGSGNASVAAHLRHTDALNTLGARYQARQGAALGRNGRVDVSVEDDGVWIGGACTEVIRGELTL